MVSRYITYYLASKTLKSIQSPTISALISGTLEDDRNYYAFRELEAMRADMLRRDDLIKIVDLGAGSRVSNNTQKSIAQIAKTSLSTAKKAQFLFRLVKYMQPNHILELGTSLGLSALYMHKGCSSAKLTTIEGSPEIAHVAKHYFDIEKADISLINSSFDDALNSPALSDNKYEIIYLDGNHTQEATLRYVDMLYGNLSEDSVVVLDDIYWSSGMTKAWKQLKVDKRFNFAIDLYDYGLLIKKAAEEGHKSVSVIEKRLKPF